MGDWQVGELLSGRYRLERRLGAGGMGRVWQAFDLQLQRAVAVKELLLPEGADTALREELVRRIQREARAAAALRHPSLVAVHDITVDASGVPAVVMELVRGEPLDEVVRREGRLGVPLVTAIARQVLEALREAHAAGVVHRDIKPANILWDGRRAVVVDFGIATLRDARATALTQSGRLVGSAPYLAPEQFRGEPLTAAVDLWGLGVTLFELVEGQRPFTAGTPEALMRAILDAPTPPVTHAAALGPLITALLTKDPAARPTLATAERLLPVPTAPDQAPARAPQPESATVRLRVGVPSPPSQPPRRFRRRHVVIAALAVCVVAAAGATALLLGGGDGRNDLVIASPSSRADEVSLTNSARSMDGVVFVQPLFPESQSGQLLVCVHADRADQVAAALLSKGSLSAPIVTSLSAARTPLPPALAAELRRRAGSCLPDASTGP